ncbi:MAG: lytic murein transglycosylase, partial [Syntrophorhabdaceae bacterium]|nr:lytic murein transglycosylase [Syntrophorhabdaceae bacterium]
LENRRSEWAENELVNLIVLSRLYKKDIFSIKGSWAGAFGICQFVPTAFLNHAVDGDNNGTIDLFNFHDAMSSMANYLKNHGWEKGNLEKMKKAVWHYNHCDNYVKAVFLYSRAIKNRKSTRYE